MDELTPYDTGARLEPRVWVHENVTSPNGEARPAEPGDYGRVDFDNDEGATVASLYIEAIEHGYAVRIHQQPEDYLSVSGATEPPQLQRGDPRPDAEYRIQQGLHLMQRLQDVGDEFSEHVFFTFEGDPNAFDPGHMFFLPADGKDGSCFAVEERYADPMGWASEQPEPVCWDWYDYGPARTPEGGTVMRLQAQGTTIPSDIDQLVDRARGWAHAHSERAVTEQAYDQARFIANQMANWRPTI